MVRNKEAVDWSHLSLIKWRQWVLEAPERLPKHGRDLAFPVRQQDLQLPSYPCHSNTPSSKMGGGEAGGEGTDLGDTGQRNAVILHPSRSWKIKSVNWEKGPEAGYLSSRSNPETAG